MHCFMSQNACFSLPSTRTTCHFLFLPKLWCSIYGKLPLENICGILQRIIAMINRLSIFIICNRSAAKISQNMIFDSICNFRVIFPDFECSKNNVSRQVQSFFLKEYRKNNLKNNFSCNGKWFMNFSFWIQGYHTVQRADCAV